TLVVDAVASLNALADSRAGQGVQLALPRRIPGHELSDCQRSMLANIARMVKLFDPPIPNSSFEGGALAELVRSSSIYDVEDTSTSARYAPSKLKVLEGRARPIDARELVGDYAREYLDNPNSKIALDAVARAAVAEPIQPRWDPSLRQPGPRRRDLIRRLDAVGLLAYRRRRLGRVGMFFVKKKDKGAIRLALDARPVNELQKRPPKSRLATPGALSCLNLSDQWFALCAEDSSQLGAFPESGGALEKEDGGVCISGAGVDLKDGFYKFGLPSMSSWFCLGELCTARELNVAAVFDEDAGRMEPLCPDDQLRACFGGLAMGRSRALFFCHSAQEEAGRRATCRVGCGGAEPLADWRPSPAFGLGFVAVAPYVDNGNVIGGSLEATAALHKALTEELRAMGFVTHENVDPAAELELAGRRIEGTRRSLAPRSSRTWRPWRALRELEFTRGSAPGIVRRVVGHIVDHFSTRRELLSTLQYLCPFTGDGRGEWREFDANELAEIRFRELGGEREDDCGAGALPDETPELETGGGAFSAWAAREVEQGLGRLRGPRVAVIPSESQLDDVVEVVGLVPALCHEWGPPERWRCIRAGSWKRPDKIDNLEARAAPMGLADHCSHGANHNAALLFFGDNGSEILACDRGRARAWKLLALLRCGGVGQGRARRAGLLNFATLVAWAARSPAPRSPRRPPSRSRPPLGAGDSPRSPARTSVTLGTPLGAGKGRRPFGRLRRPKAPRMTPRSWPRRGAAARRLRHRGLRRRGEVYFLELFAGRCRLTAGALGGGLRCAVPVDHINAEYFDVTRAPVSDAIVQWILCGSIWAFALGTPCTRWSASRRGGEMSDSAASASGLACAKFSCRVVRACLGAGAQFVIENPRSSHLWSWPPLERLLRRAAAVRVELDMCAFGAAWKKPTLLVGNLQGLERMEARCPRHARHVVLQGVLRGAAPPAAWRKEGEPRLDQRREEHLAACLSQKVNRFVHVDPLPAKAWPQPNAELRVSDAGITLRTGLGFYVAWRWDGAAVSAARYALYGVAWTLDLPIKAPSCFALAKATLRAFSRRAPEKPRGPPCEEMLWLFVDFFIKHELCLVGFFALLACGCCLRPSEAIELCKEDLCPPAQGASIQKWSIAVAPSTRDRPAKNRQFDAGVVAAWQDRRWMGPLLKTIFEQTKPGELLFRGLALAAVEKAFKQASDHLGY
ncbi:unnamed protein product, partial [Prorocentrum cordatum]